jgi:F-type H+-transporting ATPase subunit a
MNLELNGAKILFESSFSLPLLGNFRISQTMLMGWIILGIVSALCIWLGHGLKVENVSKRQAAAEFIVETLDKFLDDNMGKKFEQYIPLIGALFATSVVSNLISILGFWSPTADLSTEAAWAILVFVLITYYKIRTSGLGGYLKGYLSPIFIMAPINVISELATPVSMACRHFGNILSGMVISTLVYAALASASYALLGMLGTYAVAAGIALAAGTLILWRGVTKTGKDGAKGSLPLKILGGVFVLLGALGLLNQLSTGAGSFAAGIPWLNVGIPAILSLYFDWFSGCIQAFIFCMLTMIYIKQAAGET